jgi:NDP-sugar pyrophosphorylase family protein
MRGVSSTLPKPMLPVAGRPFVEYLLRYLSTAGVRRAVLAIGYRAETMRAYFAREGVFGLELLSSSEAEPLGGGGPLRRASRNLECWPALVLNGD